MDDTRIILQIVTEITNRETETERITDLYQVAVNQIYVTIRQRS